MTFNSVSYFLFLPIIYLVFYVTPERWRRLLLLVVSYWFYSTFKAPYLLAVLLMETIISYACGLRLASHNDEGMRKFWFWGGVVACVAILALFKYLPFLEATATSIFGLSSIISTTIISLGVSYFTFQAISYLADVYLEIEDPERHFGIFALYMAFFPKLLQGPIERAGDLLPQLRQPYQFDYDSMRSGMLLFTCGLFKKVVVADRLALYADLVYNNAQSYTGLPLILGTYAYALQIYFDFSGYTDMARGVGRMFGINLTENFNSPYLATSIADFWRRWHISFSRWILDYIFKPLQMSWRARGKAGTAVALVVTFLVSGIWHGASWCFVVWGLLHGIYLATSLYYRPYQKRLYKLLDIERSRWLKLWQIVVTFNLVSFAWIFFRQNSLSGAWYILTNMFNWSNGLPADLLLSQGYRNLFLIVTCIIISTLMATFPQLSIALKGLFRGEFRWFFYYSLVMMVLVCGQFQNKASFIYGRF
jgi:D-alanyl-lipoteichoic acid acyltransferase DltB (MBOAT superfamily)